MRAAAAFAVPVGPPLDDLQHGMMVHCIFYKALKLNKLNNFDKVPKLLDQPLGGLDA